MIELQYKLEKAIEEERYEDAAEIQKQIDKLKAIYKSFFWWIIQNKNNITYNVSAALRWWGNRSRKVEFINNV